MIAEYILLGDEEQINYVIEKVITPNDIHFLGYYDAIFEDSAYYGVAFRTQTDTFNDRIEQYLENLIQYRIIRGKEFTSYSLKRIGDSFRRCEDLVESEDLILFLDVGEVDEDWDKDYRIPEED